MKVITKAGLIANVAEAWKQRYYYAMSSGKYRNPGCKWQNEHSEKVYDRLLTATTEDEISAIIGNKSWTANKCSECSQDKTITVQMGDGYGEYTPEQFCLECLGKARDIGYAELP